MSDNVDRELAAMENIYTEFSHFEGVEQKRMLNWLQHKLYDEWRVKMKKQPTVKPGACPHHKGDSRYSSCCGYEACDVS